MKKIILCLTAAFVISTSAEACPYQKMAEVEAAGARLQAAQERKKALEVELGEELVLAHPLGPLAPAFSAHDVVAPMGKGDHLFVLTREVRHQ